MNWKKIGKYFMISWALLTIVFIFWMKYGLITMYGGHTTKVDHQQFDPYVGPVVIANVNILSVDSKSFIEKQSVYIDQGKIIAIDSLQEFTATAKVIDGSDKFLIPGLIDSHVHLFKSPNDLLLYIANGVTHIREMIGEADHLKWKQEIGDGRIGPEMFVASPRMGSFGTIEGWFMSWAQGYLNIANPRDAEKSVKKLYAQGYDGIKIYSQINKESYDAVCQTAESLGMKVIGHLPMSVELADIYQSGQSEIAHFEEIMNALNREFGYYNGGNAEQFLAFVDQRCKEVTGNLIKNNIAVTSTMWGTGHLIEQKFDLDELLTNVHLKYANPGLSEWSTYAPGGPGWLPEVNMYKLPQNLTSEERAGRKSHWETYIKVEHLVAQKLIEYGVQIMAGTDANIPVKVPGFSLHDELEALVTIGGMTPSQALQSATSTPAKWLGSNSGTIAIGREANLVLLNNNPLENINNTRSINTVLSAGKLFDRALLDKILKSVVDANDESRNRDISEFLVND